MWSFGLDGGVMEDDYDGDGGRWEMGDGRWRTLRGRRVKIVMGNLQRLRTTRREEKKEGVG